MKAEPQRVIAGFFADTHRLWVGLAPPYIDPTTFARQRWDRLVEAAFADIRTNGVPTPTSSRR